jgi:hypothetical protein
VATHRTWSLLAPALVRDDGDVHIGVVSGLLTH